jgi:hypothetical protein
MGLNLSGSSVALTGRPPKSWNKIAGTGTPPPGSAADL